MISRATCIPKFNAFFFRQISSTSLTLYNRKVANVEELAMSSSQQQQQSVNEREASSSKSHQTTNANRRDHQAAATTKPGHAATESSNVRFNANQKSSAASASRSKPTNAIKNLSELANQTNLSFDDKSIRPMLGVSKAMNRETPQTKETTIGLPLTTSTAKMEEYEQMVKCLTNDLTSISDTLLICQKMVDLFDAEPSLLAYFKSQPIKKEIIKRLAQNYDKIAGNTNDLLTILQFGLKIDEKVNRVESLISLNINKLNGDQLVKLISLFRQPSVTLPDKQEKALKYMSHFLKSDQQNIETFSNMLLAMKLFSHNSDIIRSLDEKVIRQSDKLTTKNWLDLLNTKSILRLRDVNILQACTYQVTNSPDSSAAAAISLEDIQRSLLSCGVLNFFDNQFHKFLLDSLNKLIQGGVGGNKLAKTAENEAHLTSIINSMGILMLRQSSLLKNLCKHLHDNYLKSNKILVSYVTSCGFLNFKPKVAEFAKIVQAIDSSNIDQCQSNKEKLAFLNYVWSTCVLNCPNEKFIAKALDESFWTSLLDEPSLKSVLTKLFNINLYTMIYLEDYKGPELPAHMNAEKYADVLPGKKDIDRGSLKHVFLTTLTSFRSIDKYFKVNMLTSYGILIDALMISDKNGMPKLLADHFDENMKMKLNEKENDFAVAFKLINFKDHTHVEKALNGSVSIQLNLLNELGYCSIPITHEELMAETTIINRVQLIKRKLQQAAQNRLKSSSP